MAFNVDLSSKRKKKLNIEALKQKYTETENFLQNILPS